MIRTVIVVLAFIGCDPAYPADCGPYEGQGCVNLRVLQCDESDLVLSVETIAEGSPVYSYSGTGCRIRWVPEPGMGGALVCGAALVVLLGRASGRASPARSSGAWG